MDTAPLSSLPRAFSSGSSAAAGNRTPPARAARGGTRRPLGAPDRTDRWRQDARRFSAQPDRARRAAGRAAHTLYVSPLKALTVDVQRNLMTPIAEMALPVRAETRTGDTPAHKRSRQRERPPQILLTRRSRWRC